MKIFSLETKKHLLGWGIALGWLLSIAVNLITLLMSRICYDTVCVFGDYGFPFRYSADVYGAMIFLSSNAIFWILAALIFLGLVKHFEKKSDEIMSKYSSYYQNEKAIN